jgi:hypothetical protein
LNVLQTRLPNTDEWNYPIMVYWRLFVNDRFNPHGGEGHWKKVLKYEFDS